MFFLLLSCQSPTITPDLQLLKELENNPEQAQQICTQLSGTDAKKRCHSIAMRPHLWENPASMETTKSKRTVGPPSKHLTPNVPILSPPYIHGTTCTSMSCCEREAKKEVQLANIIKACGGIQSEKWRAECSFIVAEEHLNQRGYAHSAQLCLYSGDYAANCFMHLSYRLAETTPPALTEEKEEWENLVEHTRLIRSFWNTQDPKFGEAMVQQLWGKALDVSYTKAGIVAGNPIDHLPKEVLPHIRAAASAHLMQMEGATSFSLKDWAKRTQRALDARLPSSAMRPPRPYIRIKAQQSWPTDTPKDVHIPATYYMTDGRRAIHPEPFIDLMITTLEAAARNKKGHLLVEEGKNIDNPTVQWTATRLSNTHRKELP